MLPRTLADFGSPEFHQNPFPTWEALRTSEPLYRFDLPNGLHGWMVTPYDDVLLILKDSHFIKDIKKVIPPEILSQLFPQMEVGVIHLFRQHMANFDPPEHTRLRRLVSKAFTPRMVEQLHGRIQQIADELLDRVQQRGEMDFIRDFAFLLPVTVICEMLGTPVEDREKFRTWSNTLITQQAQNSMSATQLAPGIEEFVNYLRAFIAEKRLHPDNKLMSQLIRIDEAGDRLSEAELISMAFLLLVAGHETTVNLIGNGTLALLLHPDQMRKLQADPSLIASAVEELLRHTAPVTLISRWASEDVELHGKIIPRGSIVFASLIAAGTDPKHFSVPQDLDITREERSHLAFGKGIHYCLGAPLARLEGQIAFSTLLRRMPNLHLMVNPQDLHWRPGLGLRGLLALPVAF